MLFVEKVYTLRTGDNSPIGKGRQPVILFTMSAICPHCLLHHGNWVKCQDH